MLKLHFKDSRQAPIWLVEERFTIGQDRRNQLVLGDPGISDFHAEILLQDGQHFLRDCGSAAGTFVNGERIGGQYQLRPRDQVRIGNVELLLLEPNKAPSVRPDATVRWFLQVVGGEQVGKKFHVQPGSLGFGRSPKSELCFSDPELSRRHCEFFLKDDVLEVKDLASANGVYVNHKKVATAALRPGDEVRMGSVTLLVIGPNVAARPPVEEEDDSDATQFVRAIDLPKAEPRAQVARGGATANPLRAAAPAPAAVASVDEGGSLKRVLLIGSAALLAVVVGALLFLAR
ncbi:FHA domain-containing protein [Pseudomonas oryzae]|uniref:FHA domain-containing protein n=1 Tax=Pseudomonas oryzae TaxID=1392877 RepID=A0A1H1U497_9PSED|nr:FHA domain-containing protein [Pseudomonas oryzae]SDS67257.1 FHA domain-containing protein [Pseudomonas oryzae]